MAGRFLGIGVDEYTDDTLPKLEHAVSDVKALQDLLGSHFEGNPLENPDAQSVRDGLSDLKGAMLEEPGALVLMWAGHGVPSLSVGLRLPACDSDPSKDEGFDVNGDLGSASGLSGAGQILLIVDTCYSGKAISAATVIGAILQAQPPDASYVWVGVLASCQTLATAQDGLFGRTLRRVLEDGPTTPELKLRWSTQNEFIRGDDLCDAVLKEWDGDAQKPQFEGNGSAWWMFPNPLYRPNAPEQVVEHLLLAARGGARPDERSWFTGRTLEVDRVVGWVLSGEPGMHVVTGSAGSGKSAIVGRVVSLSNPQERERLLEEDCEWSHADPGERSVQAHVHARGLTADRAADLLGDELVRCSVLTPQPERRNASELVGQVQRAVETGKPPPVVVVDGLDEARGEAFSIAEDLLARLAEHAVVVVSTRELWRGDEREPLTATLAPRSTKLELDDAAIQERGRAAMLGYVAARLADVDEHMDGEAVADHLTRETSMTSGSPFLLARLVTDRLRERPIDTSLPKWHEQVSGSIDEALDADLARVTPRRGLDGAQAGRTASDTARGLLYVLTWGLGAGLPEDEWLTVTHALLPDIDADRDDVTWVLDQLGRYVVQDGEDGVATYRLAHQSLADHLRPPYQATREQPFDPDALPVARALLGRYKSLLAGGVDVHQPAYLWRYAWRHAALAGPRGLELLRGLARRVPELVPDVGAGASLIADIASRLGRPHDAVSLSEEAVDLYRGLARENPVFIGDLARALSDLGVRYSEVDRAHDAVSPSEEAVELYRGLARENPVFIGDLAGTLNNLGIRYSEVDRSRDGVSPTGEAVDLYRGLAGENPVFIGDLAMALNNLGIRYSEVDRAHDAVSPSEEAVDLYRGLARENPVFIGDLARALSNLGNRYSEVDRSRDGVSSSKEAVDLYRGLAGENPVFIGDLAGALSNLGVRYSEVDRAHDGVSPSEEAVDLYRGLVAENSVFRRDLAMALNNLSIRYSEVDRSRDGVSPSEEAVDLYRGLVVENSVFRRDLAMALNNLGVRYSEVDRSRDGVSPSEEAVELYRGLAGENSVFRKDLAGTLSNLGIRYSEVDRAHDGVSPSEEAVELYRALAGENSVFTGGLAMALSNLGVRYSEVDRAHDGVSPSEEAVELYRALAGENSVFTGGLAMALSNLGVRYSEIGEPERADTVWDVTLKGLGSAIRSMLLLARVSRAAAGESNVVGWLTTAVGQAGEDQGLVGALHDQARRHRNVDAAAFDKLWQLQADEQPPAWLTVDTTLLARTRAWIQTSTYAEERDYIAAHPELLPPAADIAVQEALLGVIDEEGRRYMVLRETARTEGVEAAYEPLLLTMLAHEFMAGNADIQRGLLARRRDELFRDTVLRTIGVVASEREDGHAQRALALLTLAAAGDDAATLDAVDEPSLLPTLLLALAERSDPTALAPAAFIALTAATTAAQAAEACFFMAVAAAIAGEGDDSSSGFLDRARTLDPERSPAWITQLAELASRHPEVLPLISSLSAPPDSQESPPLPNTHATD